MFLRAVDNIYGYLRLNQKDSNNKERTKQFGAFVRAYELNIIYYEETVRGNTKAENREKLQGILKDMKSNDVLLVVDYTDLGYRYEDILNTLNGINKKKSRVCMVAIPLFNKWEYILDESIYKEAFELLICDLEELNRMEKLYMSGQTKKGIEQLDTSVKKIGRPKEDVPEYCKKEIKKYIAGAYPGITLSRFSDMLGKNRNTVAKYIKKMREAGEID